MSWLSRFGLATGRFLSALTRADYSEYNLTEVGYGKSAGLGSPRSAGRWLDAFGKHSRLQAAVNRIALDVAKASWLVLRDDPVTVQPAVVSEPHSLHTFLAAPWYTGSGNGGSLETLLWLMEVYYELTGEIFLLMRRKPGEAAPREVWPIPPNWIMHIPTPGLPYYLLTVPGQEIPDRIPSSEVIWIRRPNPANPFGRGLSIAASVDDEVSQDEWAAKYNAAFFRQGARPDLLISVPGAKTKTDRDTLREEWNSRYSGFWNAFKAAFISSEAKVQLLTVNHKDLEFVDGRKFLRDVVFQTWGLPPEIMGVVENSNRATAEAALYIYSLQVLLPRMVTLAGELNRLLVPLFNDPADDPVYLGFESPVRETEEFRLNKATELFKAGAITRNECREVTGFDPIQDERGDEILQPSNTIVINQGGAPAPPREQQLKIYAPDALGRFRQYSIPSPRRLQRAA